MSVPRSTRAKYDAETLGKMIKFVDTHWLQLRMVNFYHPNDTDPRTIDEKYWDYAYKQMKLAEKEETIARLKREVENGIHW